jgi:hypothetical protein
MDHLIKVYARSINNKTLNYGTPLFQAEFTPNSLPCGGASAIWNIYLNEGIFLESLQLILLAASYKPSKTASGSSPVLLKYFIPPPSAVYFPIN